eukprot:TRINITY_DN7937_c0_g1_i1.p1 TRINITY_DN7937_c0_g1~~TRINITY_DN7937_c0_g1_i1.p1  ORF type:complete len:1325 (+),score=436.16 TRINITY_DN7937_c0_g1_i1:109-4083(+)
MAMDVSRTWGGDRSFEDLASLEKELQRKLQRDQSSLNESVSSPPRPGADLEVYEITAKLLTEQARNHSMATTNQRLQQDVQKAVADTVLLQGQQSELTERCNQLLEQIAQLEDEKRAQATQISQLQGQKAEATEKYNEIVPQLRQLDTHLRQTESQVRQLEDDKKIQASQVGVLQAQKVELAEKCSQLMSQLKQAEQQRQHLLHEADLHSQSVESVTTEKQQLARQLEQLRRHYTEQNELLLTVQRQQQQMARENQELQQQTRVLGHSQELLNEDLRKLEAQDKTAISALHQQLQMTEQQCSELFDENDLLRANAQRLENTVQQMTGAHQALEQQRDTMSMTTQQQQQQLATMVELEDHCRRLQQEHQSVTEQMKELGREHASLNQQLKTVREECNNQVTQYEDVIVELEEKFHRLNVQHTDASARFVSKIEEQRNELTRTLEQVRELQQEHVAYQHVVEPLNKQLREQAQDLRKFKKESDDMAAWVAELQSTHAHVKRDAAVWKQRCTKQTTMLGRVLGAFGKERFVLEFEHVLLSDPEPFFQREILDPISTLQKDLREHAEILDELRRRYGEIETAYHRRDGECEAIRQERDSLAELSAALRKQLETAELKHIATDKESAVIHASQHKSDEMLRLLQAKCQSLEQQLEASRQDSAQQAELVSHGSVQLRETMQREIDRINNEIIAAKSETREQKDIVEDLREQLAQVERRNERLEARIKREGRERVQELQDRVDALEGERERLLNVTHDDERKLARFLNETHELRKEIVDGAEQLAHVRSSLDALHSTLAEIRVGSAEDQKAIQDANQVLLQLRAELDDKTATLRATMSDLQRAHDELIDMQTAVDELDKHNHRQQVELEGAKVQMAAVQARYADAKADIERQKQLGAEEASRLKQQLFETSERHTQEIDRLRSLQLSEMGKHSDQSSSEMDRLKRQHLDEVARLKSQHSEYVNSLNEQISAGQRAIADCEARLSSLTQQQIALEQQRDMLQTELNESRDKHSALLTEMRAQALSHQTSLQDAQNQTTSLTSQLGEALSRANDLSLQLKSSEHSRADAIAQLQSKISELRETNETCSQHVSHISQLEHTLSEKTAESLSLQGQVEDLQKQRDEDEARVAELLRRAQHTDAATVRQLMESRIKPEIQSLNRQSIEWADSMKQLQTKIDQQNEQMTAIRLKYDEQAKTMQKTTRDHIEQFARFRAEAQDKGLLEGRLSEHQLALTRSKEYSESLETKVQELERQLRASKQSASSATAAEMSTKSRALVDRYVGEARSRRISAASDSLSLSLPLPPPPTLPHQQSDSVTSRPLPLPPSVDTSRLS